MASLEQIAAALRAADAAGNVEDAKRLAAAYRQAQASTEPFTLTGKVSDLAPKSDHQFTDLEKLIVGQDANQPRESANVEWAPGQAPRPSLGQEAMSFGRGIIEGIPILGPTLADWRQGLDANVAALFNGGNAEDYKARYKAADEALKAKTGGARLGGNITGSVLSLGGLGATATGGRLLGMTGSLGQRLLAGAGSGAVISGADTLARGGSLADAGTNALLGAGLGMAFPAVGAAFRKGVSPVAKGATDAASKLLANEGVDLTAGQITGSRGLRFREAELGGNTAAAFMERQAKQFTAAALKRAGINATEASHDVLDGAFTQIGQQFDDLAARNFIQPDKKLATDLQAAWRRFEGSTNPQTRPKVIERLIGDIYGTGNGQRMTGEWYKATRSELGRLSKSANPELAEAARDLQFALDDAMERTMKVTNPADAGAWKAVRGQYKNLLVIEDAATRAGAQSADGIITPQALRSAAMRQNKRAFARGRNDFTDLADAGVSKMTPLPDSGTPGRLDAKAILPLGAGAGMGIGGTVGGIPGMVLGGVAGAAIPWAVGKAALSKAGRAYLSNSAAAGGKALPALPPALLSVETTKKRPIEITVTGGAR